MIKLYQYAPAFGLPSSSPFCMKLETYLRMTGLPFEIPRFDLGQIQKAPKGKMPYIEDQGQIIADSGLVIEHLKVTYGDKLDGWLTAEQSAVALAFQRMLEENLYWAAVYARWVAPQGWPVTKSAFFAKMPAPLKWFVPALARAKTVKNLQGHGMGRHSEADIYAIGQRDLSALADFLGDKAFFMGAQPTSLDASAYGFLANLLWVPLDSPLKQHALKYPKFEAYCQRMKAKYYSETM